MAWTCEQIEGRLSEFLEGTLAADERAALEAHTASCERCARLAHGLAFTLQSLHRLEPLAPPPQLVDRILRETLGPRAEKKRFLSGWLAWLRPVWQPRFAYGAVSVLVTLAVLSQAFGVRWHKPSLAALHPVALYREADRHAHLIYARGTKFVSDLRVVYEIQSRLRPALEPEETTAPQTSPGRSPERQPGDSQGPAPRGPRELNRAKDLFHDHSVLAVIVSVLPARSVR